MLLETDVKLDFNNVLLRPKRSTAKTRKDVNLFRGMKFRNSKKEYFGIPIMAANMDGVGTLEMAKVMAKQGLFTCLNKPIPTMDLVNHFDNGGTSELNYTAMTIGASPKDEEKFFNVYEQCDGKMKYLCIDVANGYTEYFSNFVYNIRKKISDITIIAGHVVTADMTQELILNGADIVKVGIGPGSVCTTRIQTGVGYPQLSAIIECADAAHGLGAHIIGDGGCAVPGDIAKAFGGGADFVMIGGMLAGHDQGGGEIIRKEHITSEIKDTGEKNSPLFNSGSEAHRKTEIRKFIQFYGMSSEIANDRHFGGLKDYKAAEGKEVRVPYRGDVQHTIQEILGSLRSTCTYIGADRLKDMARCTTFIRCTDTHNRVYE